jgi:kynurenine 3-monooxygenase
MVPFYGQGLNCGLEDVRVLSALLRDARAGAVDPLTGLGSALATYSETRHEDLVAICDLAMNN